MKFRTHMDALAVIFLRSTFVDEKWTMMTISSTSWPPVLQQISCRGIGNPFRKAGETSLKNLDADLGQDRGRLAADFESSPPFIVFFLFPLVAQFVLIVDLPLSLWTFASTNFDLLEDFLRKLQIFEKFYRIGLERRSTNHPASVNDSQTSGYTRDLSLSLLLSFSSSSYFLSFSKK